MPVHLTRSGAGLQHQNYNTHSFGLCIALETRMLGLLLWRCHVERLFFRLLLPA